jgi:hypothetical protein
LLSAFRGPYLWLTIKVSLMAVGAQGGGWAVGFWMPTYLRTGSGLIIRPATMTTTPMRRPVVSFC